MAHSIYRFIIKPIGMNLLLHIEHNAKIKELSAKTGMTQGHINIILLELQKNGIIERIHKNRHISNNTKPAVYFYNRTEKGEKIAAAFKIIKKIIGSN